MKKNRKTVKNIKRSQFGTYIHGGRNGRTHHNVEGESFVYDNGIIFCMEFNSQVIYRGRRMLTHCVISKHKKNMKLSKQKGARSCATISQVLDDRN